MVIETIQKTMENEKKEVENKEVEETTNQTASTDEKNTEEKKADTQEVSQEEEKVTLSKKELEDLQKRAKDFDRSIELKRLKKLEERGEIKTETGDDVKDEIAKLRDELSTFKAQSYNSNLSEAYRSFVAEHPWANDDAKFDKIKENFSSVGTETKEELYSKLKSAAQNSFPTEYEKHLEDRIKAKILSEKSTNNSGGGSNSDGTIHKDENNVKTAEEKIQERAAALLAKYRPFKR